MWRNKEFERAWTHSYALFALLVLGIGLLLAFVAYQQVSAWQRSKMEAQLGRRARICQQRLQRELGRYLGVVRSVNQLFYSSREVTRWEFREFVSAHLGRHRAIRTLAWVPRVPGEQREAYQERARREGLTGFQFTEAGERGRISPASRRGEYLPVYYLEPMKKSQPALGLDLASHSGLHAALRKAGNTGQVAASARTPLVPGGSGRYSALVLSPVHGEGKKEGSLLGFVLGAFHVGELLESALGQSPQTGLDLWLVEENGSAEERILAFYGSATRDQTVHNPGDPLEEPAELEQRLSLEAADSRWTLVARPGPAFLAIQPAWQAPLAFGVIAAFSLLSAALVTAAGRGGRRYQRLASELQAANQQLEASNQQLRTTEEDLRKSEELFRQLFQQAAIGILVSDAEHRILEANQKALSLLGYSRDEILGLSAREFIHPDDLGQISLQGNLERMVSGETLNMERRYRTRSGAYIHVLVNMAKLTHYYSDHASHMVMFQDISERKRAEERVYSLAYFDELTGLPNRSLFHERLSRAVSRSESIGGCGAVFLLDIHRLRSVNDTLGQEAGNELIREVGRRIWGRLREEDTLARVSGGEFMILAEGIDSGDNARRLGLRVLERIGQEFELSHRRIYPEASIGFTLFPSGAMEPDSLIKQADMAMSVAKKSVNKIQEFAGQEDWISREFHLEQDLKRALAKEQFQVFYQPQIELASGDEVGLEALLRWSHPERGPVSPAEFIPVLERTGMIGSVDAWVIRRVCHQLMSWREQGIRTRVSVNLSAQELGEDSILGVVSSALEENRLPASALGMELTETELMENMDLASGVLRTLSDWGVRVALDDFGKGYSCLSYLQKLDIHVIKIDKEFVAGLPESAESVTLVQTIVDMAHNMGKEVLAEGVERREQWQKLFELGCDYGQGFLWGRPRPAGALTVQGE